MRVMLHPGMIACALWDISFRQASAERMFDEPP